MDHLGISLQGEGTQEMEKARGRTLGPGRVDTVKVDAVTKGETRQHMIEDGLDPDNPLAGFTPVSKVAEVRRKADLSQDAFARALHVPVKTIRNWEQGRSRPDPAARALLAIVDDDPARAFQAIERRMSGSPDDAPAEGPSQDAERRTGPRGRGSQTVMNAAGAAMKTDADTPDAALKTL